MTEKINRRKFIKQSSTIGASAIIGGQFALDLIGQGVNAAVPAAPVDLAVITGTDYFTNTVKAVETTPGTNVNTDIVLAMIDMCYETGAKKIVVFKEFARGYWDNSEHTKEYKEQIKSLEFSPWDTKKVDLPKAKTLKEAHVITELLECDVYINITITKHHEGTLLTGTIKNAMGASPHKPTNRFCHEGPNYKGDFYEDIPHLTQCIADLNLVRKPDLCICDGTEFITENGPFGPGPLKQLNKIVAGIDPVATDAYCASFLGLDGPTMPSVLKAVEHGLGTADLKKMNIKELDG